MRLFKKILPILLLTIISVINFNCKKIPFDYRSKYVGEWHFKVASSSWQMNSPGSSKSYEYNGEIMYSGQKDKLLIQYCENCSYDEITIDNGGEIDNGAGTISRKTIYLSYNTGGLGGGSSFKLEGSKK